MIFLLLLEENSIAIVTNCCAQYRFLVLYINEKNKHVGYICWCSFSILKTMIHILVGFKGDNLIYLIDKIQDNFVTIKEKKITHTSKKMK